MLARSGNSGRNRSSCLRDMLRAVPQEWKDYTPKVSWLPLNFRKKRYGSALCRKEHPFLLPSTWLKTLHQSPSVFRHIVLGPPGALSSFWETASRESWFSNHPVVQQATDLNKVVPLGLHGDDVKYQKRQKLCVISMNSVVSEGSTLDTRLVLTMLPYNMLLPSTIDEVLDIIVDDLISLGMDGAVGGEYTVAYTEDRGDLPFKRLMYHWNSSSNNSMCHLCEASYVQPGLYFTDHGPGAGWRQRRLQVEFPTLCTTQPQVLTFRPCHCCRCHCRCRCNCLATPHPTPLHPK
jgi:hypothetical protein